MDPELDASEALDRCTAQLHRTAAWLRSLPLARFGHDGGRVEQQARLLIAQVHRCVQESCVALVTEASATADVDCPPGDAAPDRLAVHALGDQLAVHAADLHRCGRACASAGVDLPGHELTSLASAALRLRSGESPA